LHRTITHIKTLGAKAGVVLNPSTPVDAIREIAADVDFVLVMSVNPGFGGQVFIPHSLDKIARVRALLDGAGNAAPIEVDGGVDLSTVERVVQAGAEWLVAGNAVFGGGDAEHAARALKNQAEAAAKR
jgi:ribulose-phosphate 3-epimerase